MLIDMTHTITQEIPVHPGDPAPVISKGSTITKDGCRTTQFSLCSHTGTHMEA
jgi:kynurenine formamidase